MNTQRQKKIMLTELKYTNQKTKKERNMVANHPKVLESNVAYISFLNRKYSLFHTSSHTEYKPPFSSKVSWKEPLLEKCEEEEEEDVEETETDSHQINPRDMPDSVDMESTSPHIHPRFD